MNRSEATSLCGVLHRRGSAHWQRVARVTRAACAGAIVATIALATASCGHSHSKGKVPAKRTQLSGPRPPIGPRPPLSQPVPTTLLGSETQNGGYGVRLTPERIVSLDLVLRGVYEHPYLTPVGKWSLNPEENAGLARQLGNVVDPSVVRAVSLKLAETRTRLAEEGVPFSIDYVIQRASDFIFVKLDNAACMSVNDDSSPIQNKVQLAYREGMWIRFCSDFSKIAEDQQTAVLVHELIYAALQEKSWVTEMVGYLFSDDFRRFDEESKKEFRALGFLLSAHVRSEGMTVRVEEAGPLPPAVPIAGGSLTGKTLCWGNGFYMRQDDKTLLRIDNVLVWHAASCRSGLLNRESVLALETKDLQIIVSDQKVGQIQESGFPESLCTGKESELCQVVTRPTLGIKLLSPGPTPENAVASGNTARLDFLSRTQGWDVRSLPLVNVITKEVPLASIAWLVDHGADLERPQAPDFSLRPLEVAIYNRRADIVSLLVNKEVVVDRRFQAFGDAMCAPTYASSFGLFDIALSIVKTPQFSITSSCANWSWDVFLTAGRNEHAEALLSRGYSPQLSDKRDRNSDFLFEHIAPFAHTATRTATFSFPLCTALPTDTLRVLNAEPLHRVVGARGGYDHSNHPLETYSQFAKLGADMNALARPDADDCLDGVRDGYSPLDLLIINMDGGSYNQLGQITQMQAMLDAGALASVGHPVIAAVHHSSLILLEALRTNVPGISRAQIEEGLAFAEKNPRVDQKIIAELRAWLGP